MTSKKSYSIQKFVVCDITGLRCSEDYEYKTRIRPNCKDCYVYKKEKEATL